MLSSKVVVPLCLPQQRVSSLCSTSLPASSVVNVLNFANVVQWYPIVLIFISYDDICGTSFHILVCYLYTFFDEVSVKGFGSLLIQVVYFPIAEFLNFFVCFKQQSFIRCVFCRYYLPVDGMSFLPLDIIFGRTEMFYFNAVQLINDFFFQKSAFGGVAKKALPYPRSSRFSPVLSSRNFIVLCFIFRSLIRINLTFVKDVRSVSISVFFSYVDVQLFTPFVDL